MKSSEIEVGAVFVWPHDQRPMRVLMHSAECVLYDAWWPHLREWGAANLQEAARKRITYYAVSRSVLLERATYLRLESLTEDEVFLHRPDLPLSVGRCAGLEWTECATLKTTTQVAERFSELGCGEAGANARVSAAQIYLYPFGPDGGQKAGVRVKAEDGTSFPPEELVLKGMEAQARYLREPVVAEGVGIYRSGLQRGIPAYYLWGSHSKLPFGR